MGRHTTREVALIAELLAEKLIATYRDGQIPLLGEGGIEAFLRREVRPYAPDAWYVESKVKIGYEISFTRHFYKPQSRRSLQEIRADILALEKETEGLLGEIIGGGTSA